jgi:hypothetical protein
MISGIVCVNFVLRCGRHFVTFSSLASTNAPTTGNCNTHTPEAALRDPTLRIKKKSLSLNNLIGLAAQLAALSCCYGVGAEGGLGPRNLHVGGRGGVPPPHPGNV